MQNRFFESLEDNNVISTRVSDHHPIIHNGILFWNIMMQCKERKEHNRVSYNNGFGIVETDGAYIKRLSKVARVVAEIVLTNPEIDTIAFCEGPIQTAHLEHFKNCLKKFPWLKPFFKDDAFHKPSLNKYPEWGLLMANKNHDVSKIEVGYVEPMPAGLEKLANRLQIWKLSRAGKESYLALAHFPFGRDEFATDKSSLSTQGKIYCDFVNKIFTYFAENDLVFCADFNLNPYLISHWKDRALDNIPHENSILLQTKECGVKAVTVDAVLLSTIAKQKYYSVQFNPGLFGRLAAEHRFLELDRVPAPAVEEKLTTVPHKSR